MSHQLPGQRFVANAEHRAEVEALWGVPPGTIRPEPGYDAVALFDALERGEVKALWVIGSNPAASMPNLPRVRRALERAELLILQDAYYPTETAGYAHVVLPAAVHFEQDGTFCNSERCVTLMRHAVPPPGDALPDWAWVQQVAGEMGFRRGPSFGTAAEIFDEFARCTAGRPNDQSGLSHALLRDSGPQQWPYPAGAAPVARRYADGVFPTASGKARLWPRPHALPLELPDDDFPLVLTTGRTLNQWHTRTKTGTVEQLNKQDPAPSLQMHPDDAARLGLRNGQAVSILSRRGEARSTLRIDVDILPGCVFLPIHWNELWSPAASPNEATSHERDPISMQPTLKYCTVAVRQCD
jgi:predicted molibdopterin-dependent oxidoreductase YjgC